MSSNDRIDYSDAQALLKKILDKHQIPLVQPTDGPVLSHIGTPRFWILAKMLRQGAGRTLLMLRIVFFTFSLVFFILAIQQSSTGITLSGEPWGPFIRLNWPLVRLDILISAYVLVAITLTIGALILIGLDMQVTWLFNNHHQYRLGQWVIYSTIIWFVLSTALGILIESIITWAVTLFPEISQQIYIMLLGGTFLTCTSLAIFLLSAAREFIRHFRPDLIRIEGRIIAVRDFLTGRKFMRWPFSGFSGTTPPELTRFFFVRESWLNWIRTGVLIMSGAGLELLLSTFAPTLITTFEVAIIALVAGVGVLGLVTYLLLEGIHSRIRSYQSVFLTISATVIVEGVAFTLVGNFLSALLLNLSAIFCLVMITYRIRLAVSENPDILNPTYYRMLLEMMSPAEAHRLAVRTLDELDAVLSSTT